MDVYKLWPDDVGGKPIERDEFEGDTQRQRPWYLERSRGRTSHFAVCPACDNPIQLVGLYTLPKNVSQPYGRHVAVSVKGLAESNTEARQNCPYFKPRTPDKSARKTTFDGTPKKIVQLLIEQFDRVVYVLECQVGIRFSRKALQGMLERYKAERGFMFTGATLRNVPWIFAYMSDATSLFMQRVTVNDALREAITYKVTGARIGDGDRITTIAVPAGMAAPFFDVKVSFIHHRVRKDGEEGGVVETIVMSIANREDREIEEILSQTITFDYDEFERLIRLPEGVGRRRMDLVQLARDVLSDLL